MKYIPLVLFFAITALAQTPRPPSAQLSTNDANQLCRARPSS